MLLEIKQVNYGMYDYDYLINRFGENICFFKASNKYIALLNVAEIPNRVIIEEVSDEPLWKQSMQLQMGRIPRKRVDRKTYVTYIVNNPRNYRFEIFNVAFR